MVFPGGNPLSDPNNSDDQLGVNEHEPKGLYHHPSHSYPSLSGRGQPQDTRPWPIQLVRGGTPQLLVLEAPDVICAVGAGSARQKSPHLKGRQLKAKTFAPKEVVAQGKSLWA